MRDFIISYFVNVLEYSEKVAEEGYAKFSRHQDILEEFLNWLRQVKYESKDGNKVCVEGYTAKELHEKFDFLTPIGVYNYLIYLREDPQNALANIAKGLPRR